MSTPRPQTPTITQCPKFAWCVQGHNHRGSCSSTPYTLFDANPEGVAAPLEPTQAEKFIDEEWQPHRAWDFSSFYKRHAIQFAEAYAAAVSKNLQQENNSLRTMRLNELFDEQEKVKSAESRILELEKEIAALRETKL